MTVQPSCTYAPDVADQHQLFLDQVIHFAAKNQDENAAISSAREVARVRNVLAFSLSRDYRCKHGRVFSGADREHFKTMSDLVAHISRVSESIGFLPCERRKLALYFWTTLNEPCQALGIPIESVLVCIDKLRKLLNQTENYSGCCYTTLKYSGLGPLAAKLNMDQHIIIPRAVEDSRLRDEIYQSLRAVRALYFDCIISTRGSIDVSHVLTELQRVTYKPTKHGKICERLRKNGSRIAGVKLCIKLWTDETRRCLAGAMRAGQRLPSTDEPANGEGSSLEIRTKSPDIRKLPCRPSSEHSG